MSDTQKKGSSLQLRPAQRQKAKLRVGLSGPSGSGKTYSALLLASGITSWDKIAVIDTENGSGELYAHLGKYNAMTLEAPYTPERYIEAIDACISSGMEVVILDSVSHEWEGSGGCLEINEMIAQAKYKGNTWAAWNETTKRHRKFIEKITSAKVHIITTARSKTDTIQTEDKKIKKVGLKEIQREGFEYELTVNFNLDREGYLAVASKDRSGLFIDSDPFVITKETGVTLKKWSNTGIDIEELERKEQEAAKKKAEQERADAIKLLEQLLIQKGKLVDPILMFYDVGSIEELDMKKIMGAIAKLEKFPDTDKQPERIDTTKLADEVDEALSSRNEAKPGAKYKETIH
jgi:hypothetical protein